MTRRPFSLVITDSGLGGMSICAGLVRRLAQAPSGRDMAITYFNAWPEEGRGYNRIPDLEGRVRVFDQALAGMERFHPDLILIACNTLSTLYTRTAFHRAGRVPVVDIIGFGLDLILEHWRRRPDSRILLLGTKTTIETGVHAEGLRAEGVSGDRILAQPCDGLATQIEQGPGSALVQAMIDQYVDQAAAKCPDRDTPLLAALCCTHFGYSLPAFRRSLEAKFTGPVSVLDPNQLMAERLPLESGEAQEPGKLELQVVSRVVWSGQTVQAISRALEPVSPLAARALRHYRHDPTLFNV
jgi:glutamate racemase